MNLNVMLTSVAILTEAHRPVLPCKIVHSWLTEGIEATGVGIAEVSLGKWTTGDKRVTCMCLGTRTDSFVASCHTVSTNTTGRPPWIIRMIISLSILVLLTCLHIISAGVHTSAWYSLALTVKSTVRQLVTLGLIKPCCISMLCGCSCVPHCPAHSSCSGLSLSTRWTGALSLVVNCTAICSWVAAPLSSTESGTARICKNISHILTIYAFTYQHRLSHSKPCY